MRTCSYCGHENEDLTGICAGCGTLLPIVSGEERSDEHFNAAADRECRLAHKLLAIRGARRPWLAVLRAQYRLVIFKSVLVAGLAAIACWIGFSWAPAFAIGCAAAFVLIEVLLLREWRKSWAVLEQWADWELVQQMADTSHSKPGGEATDSGGDAT